MRLTKKHIRQMILREMRELNESGLATEEPPRPVETEWKPDPAVAGGRDGEMWNAWFDMRVPKAWGSEHWPQYLEGPQGTVGWKLMADPEVPDGWHLAVIVPAEATELAGMFKSSDRGFYYVAFGLPAEGDAHVDQARFKQILSWLEKKWPMGKNDDIEIPPTLIHGTPERAKSFEIDPNSPVYEGRIRRDLPQECDGFEPGGYRAEGDRRLSEVKIELDRWCLLAEARRK